MKNLTLTLILLFSFSLFAQIKNKVNAELKTENKPNAIVNLISIPFESKNDSTAIYTFYRIINKDPLELENIYFPQQDSLIKKIIIPKVAVRAAVSGNVIIQFDLDSTGIAKNIRILSKIGAGIEGTIVKAIQNYKFIFFQAYIKK